MALQNPQCFAQCEAFGALELNMSPPHTIQSDEVRNLQLTNIVLQQTVNSYTKIAIKYLAIILNLVPCLTNTHR